MRGCAVVCAVSAAFVLSGPLAAEPVAEKVEIISTKKVEDIPATVAKAAPAEASPVGSEKVAAIADAEPKQKAKPQPATLRASVNLSTQTMTVTENGAVKHVWKISSGRAGYHTPTGSYKPQWMTRMHYSRKYHNSPMPHSVFYYRGYAIHATYYTGALGRPASHGCIRLSPANAKKFYRLVSRHGKARTRISVHGKTPYYAVAKKKKKKTYAASSDMGFGFWDSSPQPTTSKKKRSGKKKSYSFYKPSAFRWPGSSD